MDQGKGVTQKYQVQRDSDGNSVNLHIHVPRLRTDNLDLQTWGSSSILANQLHKFDIDANSFEKGGIQVLELGAGTGLVGLSAAVIWKANIILTDLAPLLPGLDKNIEVNDKLLAVNGTKVVSGSLDWNQPHQLTIPNRTPESTPTTLGSEHDKATVILAADTVYDEEHPRMLTDAILAWLKPGSQSMVMISYPLRVAYLDAIRDLWQRLGLGGLEAIDEGKADTGDGWDDESLHEWSVWKWRVS